ncbi:hypothetical protein ATANTOWER_028737, partial [Ataeniobius toweri]|nr:hypothetical protein [Ataeniobius toweri]
MAITKTQRSKEEQLLLILKSIVANYIPLQCLIMASYSWRLSVPMVHQLVLQVPFPRMFYTAKGSLNRHLNVVEGFECSNDPRGYVVWGFNAP